MKCYFCGGETESRTVTDLYAEGRLYLAVEDVPAEVCRQCGESYFSRDVTKELLAITKKAKQHATLVLPGQRVEVTICQWEARGESMTATRNDFWKTFVPPLVGKSFYTLDRKREFRVEEMGDCHLLIIPSTGKPRRINRQEMEGAWHQLNRRGRITRQEIEKEFHSFNAAFIASLLASASIEGVTSSTNPITLFYKGGAG